MKRIYKEPIMDIELLFVKDITNNDEEYDNVAKTSGVFDGWDDDE